MQAKAKALQGVVIDVDEEGGGAVIPEDVERKIISQGSGSHFLHKVLERTVPGVVVAR